MGDFTLSKQERLLNRGEFVNLNRSGKRYYTTHFSIIIKKNGLGITRLGVTANKRSGNAVKRNRTKRLIREFFRLNKSYLPQGYDIVVAAKKDAGYLDFRKTREELGKIFLGKNIRI